MPSNVSYSLGTPFHLTLPDSAARVLGLSDARFDANPDNAKQVFSFLDTLFQALNRMLTEI